jgi:hypothetical protein
MAARERTVRLTHGCSPRDGREFENPSGLPPVPSGRQAPAGTSAAPALPAPRERPYLLDDAVVARELNAQVLAAAAELAGGTIEATLAKTDLELGIEALIHGL